MNNRKQNRILVSVFIVISLLYSQNFIYQEDDWYILSHPGAINAIAETPFNIYFASDNGIYKFDRMTKELVYDHFSSRHLPSTKVFHFYYDSYTDYFWVVHNDGISYKSTIGSHWNEIYDPSLNTIHPWDVEDIGSNGEYICIKTSSFIVPIDPFSGEIKYLDEDETLDIDMITWGHSRFGHSGENTTEIGFLENHDQSDIFSQRRFNALEITVSLTDSNGDEWFGTISGDILKKPYYSNRYSMINIGPNQQHITEIYDDSENGIWWFADSEFRRIGKDINNHSVFLSQWIENENEWIFYYSDESVSIQNTSVNCLLRFGDFLYIGTMDGLLILDVRNREWKNVRRGLLDTSVWDMVQFGNSIFIATARGINEFSIIGNVITQPEKDRFQIFRDNEIYALEISDGFLYIASRIGLYRENLEKPNLELLSDKFIREIDVNEVHILASNGQLWEIKPKSNNHLLIDSVYGFSVFGDFVWINCYYQVILQNIKNGGEWSYSYKDGIPGNKIYTIDCDRDWVWFGTDNGIAFYNWSKYHQNEK